LQEHGFVLYRTVRQLFLYSIVCACLNAADSLPSTVAAPALEEEALPVFSEHAVSQALLDVQLNSVRRAQMLAGCRIAPLSDIEDPEAQAFEHDSQAAAIDVQGLMPNTAQALENFKDLVTSVGGTFDLKSAYRPPAYQAHLHEVWVKWVKELRGNRT